VSIRINRGVSAERSAHAAPADAAVDRWRNHHGTVIARLRDMGFDFVAFTSGTASALADLLAAGVKGSDRQPGTLPRKGIVGAGAKAGRHDPSPKRNQMPAWTRARADTILTGAIILRTVLDLCGRRAGRCCARRPCARGSSPNTWSRTAPGSCWPRSSLTCAGAA